MSVKLFNYRQATQLDTNKPRRILPDWVIKKLDILHSYLTYFLFGSFLGLALGGTYDQFVGFPTFIAENINIHTLSVIAGSCIALLSKIIFSLK